MSAHSASAAVQPLGAEYLGELVDAAVPGSVERWEDETLWVHPSRIADVAHFLRNSPDLDFQFLNAISAVDYIDHMKWSIILRPSPIATPP